MNNHHKTHVLMHCSTSTGIMGILGPMHPDDATALAETLLSKESIRVLRMPQKSCKWLKEAMGHEIRTGPLEGKSWYFTNAQKDIFRQYIFNWGLPNVTIAEYCGEVPAGSSSPDSSFETSLVSKHKKESSSTHDRGHVYLQALADLPEPLACGPRS